MRSAVFTTTIPMEVVFAAGYRPLDLNNDFITSDSPISLVEKAETDGLPGSSCAWIKGLYSVLLKKKFSKDDVFIAVTEGDCSNARVLEEIISSKTGVRSILFNFPYDRDRKKLEEEIKRFAQFLDTDIQKAEKVRKELEPLRNKLQAIDELSFKYPGLVKGVRNHELLVNTSDFGGDYNEYHKVADNFLNKKKAELETFTDTGRKKIGFLGVPPIIPVYNFIEERNATVVFNEIQREFAMFGNYGNLIDQYINYTYTYSSKFRFSKTIPEIKRRKLDGIVHYVQSFCHRQLEDIILRKMLVDNNVNIPVLTLEADKPGSKIDSRLSTRIEAFLEML